MSKNEEMEHYRMKGYRTVWYVIIYIYKYINPVWKTCCI